MKQAVSFTNDPVGQLLYRMSLPMVWGLLATMSFHAIDTYFVAQLGEAQLAAISFTFPVVMVVTSMAIGLSAGTSSVIARLLGKQEIILAKQTGSDSILLTLALSLLVVALGLLTIDPLFLLLGAPPELLPLINEYMSIWYLGAPLLLVPMSLSALLRATGNNMVWGILMMVSALINTVLDPILIFGWGPVPRMEIAGAAWATLISRLLLTAGAFYYISIKLNLITTPHFKWKQLKAAWKSILHIGLPAMGTNMIIPFASGITVALVARYGVESVAGLGVAMRIEPIVLICFYALSGVIGPFFGQNMALDFRHRQLHALSLILRFTLFFGVGVMLLLWLIAPTVTAWFSDDAEVNAVAVAYLTIVSLSYGLYGLVMSVTAAFNGLGKPMPAMVISIMRVLGFYIPLVWVGQYFWGIQGLFVATALANLAAGCLAYIWLKRNLMAID